MKKFFPIIPIRNLLLICLGTSVLMPAIIPLSRSAVTLGSISMCSVAQNLFLSLFPAFKIKCYFVQVVLQSLM